MSKITRLMSVAALLLCPLMAFAGPADDIKPYLTESTVAIIHVDLAKVDFAVAEKSMEDAITNSTQIPAEQKDKAKQGLKDAMETPKKWVQSMRDAGASQIFLLFDINQMRYGPIMVVPAGAGANQRAISGLLHSGTPEGPTGAEPQEGITNNPQRAQMMMQRPVSATVGQAVVHASQVWIDNANKAAPANLPDVATAFDTAGADSMVRVAVVGSESMRQMLEQVMPTLPPQLGGGPVTDLSRGLLWASVGIDAKTGTVKLIATAKDPQAAEKLEEIANAGLDQALTNGPMMRAIPDAQKLINALRPAAKDNQVLLTITEDQANAMFLGSVGTSLVRARESANVVKSASNMRQLLMATMMYANDNKGAFPNAIEDLKKYLGDNEVAFAQITTHPLTGRKPGYVYVKPQVATINELKDGAGRLLMYEAHDQWAPLNVGFADGHVEMIADKARFDALLKAAQGK